MTPAAQAKRPVCAVCGLKIYSIYHVTTGDVWHHLGTKSGKKAEYDHQAIPKED